MATKEIKHPIFRQFDLDDVVEIVLTDSEGEEIATAPGHRSEQELKLLAQQNGVRGPVNLVARLSSGLTNGPVQISVPAPRVPAASLFRGSRLSGAEPTRRERASAAPRASQSATAELNNEIALDSVQRLDRLAASAMTTARESAEQEREYWQAQLDAARERAREEADELEGRYERQMERVQEANEAALEEMREANERALAAARELFEERMKIMEGSHEKALREQRALEEAKIKHLATDTGEKVSLVREMSEQTTRVLESSSSQTISTLRAQLDASLTRIKDLETNREREAEAARNRYEDLRDRLTRDIERLRDEKGKAEQSRLEMMLTTQRASADDIRKEIERVTAKHEAESKELRARYEDEIKEQRRIIEGLRQKSDDLSSQMREESTKSQIAVLREQANREPLKAERLMPILSALPPEQRANLVGRAIASDIGIEYDDGEPDEKPSFMDSIGKTLTMLAASGLGGGAPAAPAAPPAPMPPPSPIMAANRAPRPQQAPQRPAAPAPAPATPASSGFGPAEEV
jgi:hypothetical protein